MNNPYLGFDSSKPSHWAWVCLHVIAVILTIPLAIGGLIPAVVLWVIVYELQPDEIKYATTYDPKAIAKARAADRKFSEDVQRMVEKDNLKYREMRLQQARKVK